MFTKCFLCIRDLKIYSSSFDGDMSHNRDRYGLEADGVFHLNDGRYTILAIPLNILPIFNFKRGSCHMALIALAVRLFPQPGTPVKPIVCHGHRIYFFRHMTKVIFNNIPK